MPSSILRWDRIICGGINIKLVIVGLFGGKEWVHVSRFIDLTGQRFGRLMVIKKAGTASANGNVKWFCRCDCGNQTLVDGYALRKGTTRSCGCLRREVSRKIAEHNPAFLASQGSALTTKDGISYSSLIKGRRNHTGVIGVSFDRKSKRYVARLMYHGKYVLNQTSPDFDEAVKLRKEAEAHYFHQSSQQNR